MSRNNKPKIAGYGLHYFATNQLIPTFTDRALFQCLLDDVRMRLSKSLDNDTSLLSQETLRARAGVANRMTAKKSLQRLEELGLITIYKNGYKVHCDEFVTLIKNYEALDDSEKAQFVFNFEHEGISIVQKCTIPVEPMCREELLGLSGSSITIEESEMFKSEQISDDEVENCSKVNIMFKSEHSEICSKVNSLAELLAKTVHNLTCFVPECSIMNTLECSKMNIEDKMLVKEAILTGKVPEIVKNDLEKMFTFEHLTCSLLNIFTSKPVQKLTPVIIEDKEKKINEGSPLKKGSEKEENEIEDDDEDFHESIRRGFERFSKVEVPSFDDELPDDENKEEGEDKEGLGKGKDEVEDYSQLVIKRAERQMRERNPYRKKRFFKRDEIEDIVNYVDDEVKSPYKFFLYLFWWGIFDLYQEHYNPAVRIDEEGELDESSRERCEWREMLNAPLPQDEIYRVAQNAYEDLCGAVEQGKYIFGSDQDEYEVTFAFKEFEDFIPYHTFQWKPCTMKDKSVPALRVEIDKFYDIETDDCYVAPARSRSTNRIRNAHSRKMTAAILKADDSQLTPMEAVIKKFYDAFVVLSDDDNMVDQWKDGRGEMLEYCDKLPDHILKPWCIGLKGIGYNGLTSVMFDQYKPIDGLHRRPWLFSAELVVEWNERNGYLDTVAHQAIKDDEDSETEEEI